ncbi:MFS transporter, partial [Acinetobacter baumannii]
ATLACLFATTLPQLLLARALQGLGAAGALSVSSALIRAAYPARQLGRGLGINSMIVASAGALSPTLGGVILHVASWQWVFAAPVP